MGRKTWIKIWTEEWLDGSIREQLSPVERSIWIDLLVMAGRSRKLGVVQSNPVLAYTHEYLAGRFKVKSEDFDEAIKHFISQQRIKENEKGIYILNWQKYQSKYKKFVKPNMGTVHDKAGGF